MHSSELTSGAASAMSGTSSALFAETLSRTLASPSEDWTLMERCPARGGPSECPVFGTSLVSYVFCME